MKVKIVFENIGTPYTESDLKEDISIYKRLYLKTYTTYERIIEIIGNCFKSYYFDNGFDCPEEDIQIPVCSNWPDKLYVFEPERVVMVGRIVYFKVMYKGIWKL